MYSKIPYSDIPPENILEGRRTINRVIDIPTREGRCIAILLTSLPQKGGTAYNPTHKQINKSLLRTDIIKGVRYSKTPGVYNKIDI